MVWDSQHDFLMIDKDNNLYYKNMQKNNFNDVMYNDKEIKKDQKNKGKENYNNDDKKV